MHILASVKAAAVRQCPSRSGSGRKCGWPEILVWRCDATFTSLAEALEDPVPCMSSGWLAVATLAARLVPEKRGILVHVGRATTSLVPIEDGLPRPVGCTETERLLSGELLYSGVARTAIAALAREVPFRGALCPVATEPAATTRDVYILLGYLEESPSDIDLADGKPATKGSAVARLARTVCADAATFGEEDARKVAEHVLREQVSALSAAIARLARTGNGEAFSRAIVSGPGEFLARLGAEKSVPAVLSLSETFGAEASRSAVAYALWVLASEGLSGGPERQEASNPQ